MRSIKTYIGSILLLLVFTLDLPGATYASVTAHIMNDLSPNEVIRVHCKSSRGDDRGSHDIEFTHEFSWNFKVTGVLKFTCVTIFDDEREARCFDAYDDGRDYFRCQNDCKWMVTKGKLLLGYDEHVGYWELFQFNPPCLL
ncbi:OLC1v1015526C1 [Oldenlandia corymbosa var. corymbosa]|uniref:S-protein homolog n=1 Tax=Oldenlandia corymbosa var. corymbosa TaxID=529605 RepID=A0AAV1E6P1_OLDCO|nr:OLC1v1015526C1 [Oldenlandia corymbosa var. corymbosa]